MNKTESLKPYLLVAAIIVLRSWVTLFRSEFWAEDATEFFFGALTMGYKSLFTAVYGYHFFISRLIAFGASQFNVLYTPYIYAWACLIFNTIAVAYFSRDGFSWIIPNRSIRVLVVALLAIAPGTSEAFLNLCNLPTPLAFLALLLLLERPTPIGWGKTLVLMLLTFSSGYLVLWLPLIGYLWWINRDKKYVIVAATIVAASAVNLFGNQQAASAASLLNYNALIRIPDILVAQTFARLVPGPFLGPWVGGQFMKSDPMLFWTVTTLGLMGVLYVLARNFRQHREAIIMLGLAYMGAIGSFAVIAFSRRYALPVLVREGGTLAWEYRYSVIPSSIVLIIWFGCLCNVMSAKPKLKTVAALGMIVIAGQLIACWNVPERQDLQWPEKAKIVQTILDSKDVERRIAIKKLAIHPSGWFPDNSRWFIILPPQ